MNIRDLIIQAGQDPDRAVSMGASQMYVIAKRFVAGDLTREEWSAIGDAERAMIGGMVMGLTIGNTADDQFDRLRAMIFVVAPGARG